MAILVCQTGAAVFGGELSSANRAVKLKWDEASGAYQITCSDTGWKFSGQLPAATGPATQTAGTDVLGGYRQVNFSWSEDAQPMSGSIRLYQSRPLVLFSDTCGAARQTAPAPFPDFRGLPGGLHVFSYRQAVFAPPAFKPSECSTPWLLFDDRAHAVVISPASHFMVASLLGDGHRRVASGFNPNLGHLPPGFSQQTMLAFGTGINRTWEIWGQSLNELRGAQRPGNDADTILKYFGYWTDNGSHYYYNYDLDKGYAGTLESLVGHYRRERIPIRYLQLDSWWYSKSLMGPDGKIGKPKSEKLPPGEWNRYGGLLEYKAHPFLFTNGLADFQKTIGLPLVTHNRWIDPASPYHAKYKISGVAAVDPKWWDAIADYLQASGIVTYEQDWLDCIYKYSPEFGSTVDSGEAFVGEMARACREHGITMQYCMPYPCYFLEGSRYENLTSIRASDDRFNPNHWNNFLYTSRLASAVGIWPWADVFNSGETNNLLLATLSAGPVGIGDAIGRENPANILRAVRADGVIVKPDAACVPLDQCYITDATKTNEPLLAGTCTDHDGLRTSYMFVYNRNHTESRTAQFTPRELGCSGNVCLYDHDTETLTKLKPGESFKVFLPPNAAGFYELAPIGPGGMALLGDSGKFVSTGKQRIRQIKNEPAKLSATVLFAGWEKTIHLHGYAAAKPSVAVQNGTAGEVRFDRATRHFMVEVTVSPAAPVESKANPERAVLVAFASGT
jgi:hypothetical protein